MLNFNILETRAFQFSIMFISYYGAVHYAHKHLPRLRCIFLSCPTGNRQVIQSKLDVMKPDFMKIRPNECICIRRQSIYKLHVINSNEEN